MPRKFDYGTQKLERAKVEDTVPTFGVFDAYRYRCKRQMLRELLV